VELIGSLKRMIDKIRNPLLLLGACLRVAAAFGDDKATSLDYSNVFSPARDLGISFSDLPGYTRSVYARDHALITPESRVWQGFPGWHNALTAHLISPANGAAFTMYLANLQPGGKSALAPAGVERFAFVLDGAVNLTSGRGSVVTQLHPDSYAFFPAGDQHGLSTEHGAGLVVFERVSRSKGKPELLHGKTEDKPVLPVPGEVFALRKLLPMTADYDFNVHIMDFQPGESLNIKEIHYNQHGLLLLQGKGIYRLANKWYPVQAGDAIWMPPYVIQWYAALGRESSRYILYKDTTMDPALHGVA